MAKKVHPTTQQGASQVYDFLVGERVVTQTAVDTYLQSLTSVKPPVVVTPPVVVVPPVAGALATDLGNGSYRLADNVTASTYVRNTTSGAIVESLINTEQQLSGYTYTAPSWANAGGLDRAAHKLEVELLPAVKRAYGKIGNSSTSFSQGVLKSFSSIAKIVVVKLASGVIRRYIFEGYNESMFKLVYDDNFSGIFQSVLQPAWYAKRGAIPTIWYEAWHEGCADSDYLYAFTNNPGWDGKLSSYGIRINHATLAVTPWGQGDSLTFGINGEYPAGHTVTGVLGALQNATGLKDDPNQDPAVLASNKALGELTRITGADQLGNLIAMTRAGQNAVTLKNKTTGATLRATTFTRPTGVAFSEDGRLWVIQQDGASLKGYTVATDGTLTLSDTVPGITKALDVAWNATTKQLEVVQGGLRQCTDYYTIAGTPTRVDGYGDVGGHKTNGPRVTFSRFLHINMDPLSLRAVDRAEYGDEAAYICILPDGSRYYSDLANFRALLIGTDKSYRGQVAYLADHRSIEGDQNNRTRVFSRFLEFSDDGSDLMPGDRSLLPESQRGYFLKYNWLCNLDPLVYSPPIFIATLAANSRTYAQMGDKSINHNDGRTYRREMELAATGPRATVNEIPAYGNGLEDTTTDKVGTLRYKEPVSATAFNIKEKAITSFTSAGDPVRGAATLLNAVMGAKAPVAPNLYSADPVPGKPYEPATRLFKTQAGNLVTFQPKALSGTSGAAHLGLLPPGATTWASRFFLGADTGGMTGHLTFPESSGAYGGTDGGNVCVAGKFIVANVNNQNTGLAANSFYVWREDGRPLLEFAIPFLGEQDLGMNVREGLEGNAMDVWATSPDDDTVIIYGVGECFGGAIQRHKITGLSKAAVLSYASTAGVLGGSTSGNTTQRSTPVAGDNILNLTGLLNNTFINELNGGPTGYGGFSATDYLPVVPGQLYSDLEGESVHSAWYTADKSFISGYYATNKVAPPGAAFIRFSFNSNPATAMLIVGPLVPGRYTRFWSLLLGGTTTVVTPPTANKSAPAIGDNILNLALGTTANTYVQEFNAGLPGSAPGFTSSGKLPVTAGQSYSSPYDLTHSAWFDAAGNYIAAWGGTTTSTAPAGAAFLQISSNAPFVNSGTQPGVMVILGPLTAVPTSYVPYWATLLS